MLDANTIEALRPLGLNLALLPFLQYLDWHRHPDDPAELQRITALQRDRLDLIGAAGATLRARAEPHLLRAVNEDALAVGDWVLTRRNAQGETWAFDCVLPLNVLMRRDPDGHRQQVLVSNVDLALLVMGMDHDFKPARLDRYLLMTRAAGVPALVVLSKPDLCADPQARIAALREHLRLSPGAVLDILAVDGTHAESARAALSPWLERGQTLVLLGSSGAGKSTLVNALCGAELQDTGGVRLDDSRGRHTTTTRTLHRTPEGACIIDTPGLRGLQLDAGGTAAAIAEVFDDVTALAEGCRYRNCRHESEPGCAVREQLSGSRLKSWHKLQREAAWEQPKSHRERREQLAMWKSRMRVAATSTRLKRGE